MCNLDVSNDIFFQIFSANDVDLSHIYEGQLVDEPGSHCFGAIRGGVFDGQIHAKDGVYYVERANRYFKDDLLNKDFVDKKINNNSNSSTTSRTSKFHSVIYHENHLIDPFHHSKKGMYVHRLISFFFIEF